MDEKQPGRFRKKFKELILKRYFIRFHMGLIVSAVTMSGVLTSKLMLALGVTSVLWRYPLAVAGSFLVFLLLIRVWLWYVAFPRVGGGIDPPNDLLDVPGSGGGGFGGFGGGDSGGAGASDSWGGSLDAVPASSPSSGSGSWFGGIDLDLDLDDAWWIVLLFAILVTIICGGAAYLVYFAPDILPDVAMQAVLASTLHGASKKMEREGWVTSIVRATWIPFVLVMAIVVVLAFAVHRHCPEAAKLLDALNCNHKP